MLTESQKSKLEDKIYKAIKEEIKGKINEQKSSKKNQKAKDDKKEKDKDNKADDTKLKSVIKWLKSDQDNNAAVVRELWPEKCHKKNGEDSARSLFSKKLRGKDSEGKTYSFTAKEVNDLYSMKDRYIQKID